MEAMRARFVGGARARGETREAADRVFAAVSAFVGYGFCKSHAAEFARTIYQTAWLKAHYPAHYLAAFLSAQPRPVRLAHHTHAAAQVITAVRWGVPTLVIVRAPADSALAHMVLRGVSARSALVAWIRYHRRIMTVRHGFVAAAFDDVTHAYGPVLRRVNEAFGTTFGVFEHTAENQARVFAEIGERNRLLRGEQMTPQRALWLARPTPEREALKDRRRGELETAALAPLRARADELHARILRTAEPSPVVAADARRRRTHNPV